MTAWFNPEVMAMKWTEILGLVVGSGGLLTALGAAVKWLSNRGTDRRMQEVRATSAEMRSMHEQYKWLKEQYDELNRKVDGLYKQLHELEDERLALIKRNNELEVALKVAQYNACERPDDDCIRRLPPRQKCRLKMLLNGTYEACDGNADEQDGTSH